MLAWGYPPTRNFVFEEYESSWKVDPDEQLLFSEQVTDSVLSGAGRVTSCPAEQCYDLTSIIPTPLVPPLSPCCLAAQTRVPLLEGGKFSIRTKSLESPADATEMCDRRIAPHDARARPTQPIQAPNSILTGSPTRCRSWNPACADILDATAYYTNLLRGSVGQVLLAAAANEVDLTPCGGFCSVQLPLCKPVPNGVGYQCSAVTCEDALPFCQSNSLVGLRARQMCPVTCGCEAPQSSLAITLPVSGCPTSCKVSESYITQLAELPCVDVTPDDSRFVAFLDNWNDVAASWPKDWKESSYGWIQFFRRWGCDYLNQLTRPDNFTEWNQTATGINGNLYWRASFGLVPGTDPCKISGTFYPVKPLSLFCPVTCKCHAGDNDCAGTCPRRNASKIDYTTRAPVDKIPILTQG